MGLPICRVYSSNIIQEHAQVIEKGGICDGEFWPYFFALIISLVVVGCATERALNPSSLPTTEASSSLESTQTEIPAETVTEENSDIFQYDERISFEKAFTFYIGRQSVDWGHYSIAPAGTEDWIPLRFTGQCNDLKHKHAPWYYSQYQIPYEGSECTRWRMKSEFLPDDPLIAELFPDAEYSCRIWEDIEIINGETVLMRGVSEDDGTPYFDSVSMPEKYCENCPKAFGIET